MAGRQGTGNRMGRKWRLWKARAVEMAGLIPVMARGCAWATVFGGYVGSLAWWFPWS